MPLESYVAYGRPVKREGDTVEILVGTPQEIVDAIMGRRILHGPVKILSICFKGVERMGREMIDLYVCVLEYKI